MTLKTAVVFGTSLVFTGVIALIIIFFAEDSLKTFLLVYFAPITILFTAYFFNRFESRSHTTLRQWIIDVAIISLAILRSVILVPFISGHSLFLTYSFLTSRSWLARITAAVIMVAVVCLKILWHEPTLLGGMILDGAAAYIPSSG